MEAKNKNQMIDSYEIKYEIRTINKGNEFFYVFIKNDSTVEQVLATIKANHNSLNITFSCSNSLGKF